MKIKINYVSLPKIKYNRGEIHGDKNIPASNILLQYNEANNDYQIQSTISKISP